MSDVTQIRPRRRDAKDGHTAPAEEDGHGRGVLGPSTSVGLTVSMVLYLVVITLCTMLATMGRATEEIVLVLATSSFSMPTGLWRGASPGFFSEYRDEALSAEERDYVAGTRPRPTPCVSSGEKIGYMLVDGASGRGRHPRVPYVRRRPRKTGRGTRGSVTRRSFTSCRRRRHAPGPRASSSQESKVASLHAWLPGPLDRGLPLRASLCRARLQHHHARAAPRRERRWLDMHGRPRGS